MKRKIFWFFLPVAFFALCLSYYLPFVADDALISLRYSQRLAQSKGLTWNDGERVEGYSNLLWVLLSTALIKLGFSGIMSVRLLGTVCSAFFLALVFFHYRRESLFLQLPLLYASVSAPLAIWAIGGLEQPLVVLLLALSVPALWNACEKDSVSAWIVSSLPLALLALTRPDGILFTGTALGAILFCRGGGKAWWILLLPFLFVAGQMAFRLAYYGDYLPNTARIKLRPSPTVALWGLKYLIKGSLMLFPFLAVSLAGLSKGIKMRNIRIILPWAMASGWGCYLVIIGGDIFPGFRLLLPLLVLFTWISIETIRGYSGKARTRAVLMGVFLFPGFIFLQFYDKSSVAAQGETWEWDGMVTALVLKDAFPGEKPLIAVSAAGALPYWTEFPSVDMLGLNDRFLAVNQGSCNGSSMAWHDICNPEYILSRNPDIISFNAAGDTTGLPVARALLDSGEFRNNYSRIFLHGSRPFSRTGVLWFNRHSSITGIQTQGDSLVIPALYFNEYKHTLCSEHNGSLGITVSPGRPAGMILMESENPEELIFASAEGCNSSVELHENGGIHIELSASQPTFVSRVILEP